MRCLSSLRVVLLVLLLLALAMPATVAAQETVLSMTEAMYQLPSA